MLQILFHAFLLQPQQPRAHNGQCWLQLDLGYWLRHKGGGLIKQVSNPGAKSYFHPVFSRIPGKESIS